MILVQSEIDELLTSKDRETKVKALTHLTKAHPLHNFKGMDDLQPFINGIFDDLEKVGAPRALSRVVLFARDYVIVQYVGSIMSPGCPLHAFKMPECWHEFIGKLDRMAELAARQDGRIR